MLFLIFFAKPIAENVCKIPGAYYTLMTLAPTIFIVGIMSVLRGYFQGMNNMIPTAFSQIVEQIFINELEAVFIKIIRVMRETESQTAY